MSAVTTKDTFYSDRAGQARPRISEDISGDVWTGLITLIRQRVNDGSLARSFPRYGCPDDPTDRSIIIGTDEEMFLNALKAHVPGLIECSVFPDGEEEAEAVVPTIPSASISRPALPARPLDPSWVPGTATVLDVVDFVALHIVTPSPSSKFHSWVFEHTDYYFFGTQQHDSSCGHRLTPGQAQFQQDIDLLFARSGIAFTLGDDLRVRRLEPPEAQSLVSDFRPRTGDQQLDDKLNDAMTRFLSRNPADRRDALEKLWDGFERLKTLELGGDKKKASAEQLLVRVASGSDPFRELLESEFMALTSIGNNFMIRHHEHGKHDLPGDSAVDYLFLRLASLIALVLRDTDRMAN